MKCQRWLLAWPGVPELAGQSFFTTCYDEYLDIATATYRRIHIQLGLDDDEAEDEDEDDEEDDDAEQQDDEVEDDDEEQEAEDDDVVLED